MNDERILGIIANGIWRDGKMDEDQDDCDLEWNETPFPAKYARAALDGLRKEGLEIASKDELSGLYDACRAAHRFIQDERENREWSGDAFYIGEARDLEYQLAAACGMIPASQEGEGQ